MEIKEHIRMIEDMLDTDFNDNLSSNNNDRTQEHDYSKLTNFSTSFLPQFNNLSSICNNQFSYIEENQDSNKKPVLNPTHLRTASLITKNDKN